MGLPPASEQRTFRSSRRQDKTRTVDRRGLQKNSYDNKNIYTLDNRTLNENNRMKTTSYDQLVFFFILFFTWKKQVYTKMG